MGVRKLNTREQEKHRRLVRLWVAVIGTFAAVLGVWMIQLRLTLNRNTGAPIVPAFGAEFNRTRIEFETLFQNSQTNVGSSASIEADRNSKQIQDAALKNLSEEVKSKKEYGQ